MDETLFRQHYERFAGPLYRYIFRFTNNAEGAQEILHDIFIKLLSREFNFTDQDNIKGWLYTLAKNHCLNIMKRQKFEIKCVSAVELAVGEFDLEAQTLNSDLHAQLNIAERALPLDLQQTWALRKKGYDYQEIAHELAIPVGTVKSRFSRLVEHLRKEFINEPRG